MTDLFKPGNALVVKSLDHQQKSSKMLIDMGITPNTLIYIEKVAPLGEPLVITVRNYTLALRKKDLMALKVELKNTPKEESHAYRFGRQPKQRENVSI